MNHKYYDYFGNISNYDGILKIRIKRNENGLWEISTNDSMNLGKINQYNLNKENIIEKCKELIDNYEGDIKKENELCKCGHDYLKHTRKHKDFIGNNRMCCVRMCNCKEYRIK